MADESVQTTWEEACRCPKCKEPGREKRVVAVLRGVQGVPNGAQVFEIVCENVRCEWHGQAGWMVQKNPDGSVPPPMDHTKKPKLYLGFEDHDQQARDIMRALRQNIAKEDEASKQEGGYEVRRRRDI